MRSICRVSGVGVGSRALAMLAVVGLANSAMAVWQPDSYAVYRAGLGGPDPDGTTTRLTFGPDFVNSAGQFIGTSLRFLNGSATSNGQDTWIFNPATNTTAQTGLFGGVYTGSAGFQKSVNQFLSASGHVAGYSYQVIGTATTSSIDTWSYNPTTHAVVQTGLLDAVHTGLGGVRSAFNHLQNSAGQVAGISQRFRVVSSLPVPNGRSTWVFNSVAGTTVQTGFFSAAYTGSAGYGTSTNVAQNSAGYVAGHSTRIVGVSTTNGQDAWVYRPDGGVTVQVGYVGGEYTGSAGYQNSLVESLNDAGQLVGYSSRVTGVSTGTGQDTWVSNAQTGATIRTGLSGSDYAGSSGIRSSANRFQNAAGHVVGTTSRYVGASTSNGVDTWIFDPATGTSAQIGLIGPGYTGSRGYQSSNANLLSSSGHVAGSSARITGVTTGQGNSTWVYDPATQATIKTGLSGAGYTTSSGREAGANTLLTSTGFVTGYAQYRSSNSALGQHSWIYNPNIQSTVRTALVSAPFTGSLGIQSSDTNFLNEAGFAAGFSQRFRNDTTGNGQGTWAYSPITNATVQTGLTGSAFTTSLGYQKSVNIGQSADGAVAGYSERIQFDTVAGQEAWYFDPATGQTYQPTLGVPNAIRASDQASFSTAQIMTDAGFLLGLYDYYAGGVGSRESHAFVYRPDVGFGDLGALVSGGLSVTDWSVLFSTTYASTINYIIGQGTYLGGSNIFVLKAVPTPSAAALLAIVGLAAVRRRREITRR